MSVISLSKLQNVIPEFVETRLMPTAPAGMKWLLAGATPLLLSRLDLLDPYIATGKALGVVDEQNRLDIDKAGAFLRAAFDKVDRLPVAGIIFNREDGEALLGILDRYKD